MPPKTAKGQTQALKKLKDLDLRLKKLERAQAILHNDQVELKGPSTTISGRLRRTCH